MTCTTTTTASKINAVAAPDDGSVGTIKMMELLNNDKELDGDMLDAFGPFERFNPGHFPFLHTFNA